MPFLIGQLPATLNRTIALQPTSTSQLCSDVKASEAFTKAPKNPSAPAPKDPKVLRSSPAVTLTGIDVLRTLGVAMLPPQHVQLNLASWHWTLLRYAYLIEPRPPGAPLRLSALAGDYQFHHMTTLSEAVGVACALSYACEWLRRSATPTPIIHDPIDFDYLLGTAARPGLSVPGSAPVRARKARNATRQPDYLVAAEDPRTRALRLLLVECKGTSSGRSRTIEQLGAAMHQLEGVTFGGGAAGWAVDRHAYAAAISKSGGDVDLYAVDPPDEGASWIPPRHEEEVETTMRRDDAGDLVIDDPPALAGRALSRLQARSLAWAGLPAEAERQQIPAPSRESVHGDVVGTTSTLTLPTGESVRVFTGVLRNRLAAATQKDTEPPASADHEHADRTEDPERVASSVSDDGLVLEVALL